MAMHDQAELATLRRHAEKLAQSRKETATSAHLLAAMACHPGPVVALFRERRLGVADLLRAARAATDDEQDPVRRACTAARQVAERMRAPQPAALHLLIALLSRRQTAAYRALDQLGVDLSRLRLAAMNLCLGQLGRKPIETAADRRQAQAAGRRAEPRQPARGPELVSLTKLRETTRRPRGERPPPSAQPERPAARSSQSEGPTRTTSRPPVERFRLAKKHYPLLTELGRNLTLEAAEGRLDRVVCREREVDRVLDVLAKRHGNNPCLVGPAGVGKTRVVHGVALRTARRDVQRGRDERLIIELSSAALLAGTGVRGGLAQRFAALEREVTNAEGRVVLFFDELHGLFSGDGGEELACEFKRAISSGALSCIGATTGPEYERSVELDPALARRFSRVEIEEPSHDEALRVLEALQPDFEAHHRVRYCSDALSAAVAWTQRFVPERALPDKAVSVLDLTGARVSRRQGAVVERAQVAEVVSECTQIPVERLLESDGARLLRLEALLAQRVVGHDENLKAIAEAVRRNAAGLGARRPIGTFLLLGPTGVGKTETAKALAQALFFSEEALTRFDLSEYGEPHTVARLLGAPPGYIGHESGGQLTEAVRKRPYQVLLFDEFEKAHRAIHESLLALLDEGRMTDGRGRTVDFSQTVVLMTSNLGVSDLGQTRTVGFQTVAPGARTAYAQRLRARAQELMSPELFNRIDEVLVFEPLSRREIREIAERLLCGLAARLLKARGLRLRWGGGVVDCLLDSGGVDLRLGARPMRRTLSRLLEVPLAEALLRGEIPEGSEVRVGVASGALQIAPVEADPCTSIPA